MTLDEFITQYDMRMEILDRDRIRLYESRAVQEATRDILDRFLHLERKDYDTLIEAAERRMDDLRSREVLITLRYRTGGGKDFIPENGRIREVLTEPEGIVRVFHMSAGGVRYIWMPFCEGIEPYEITVEYKLNQGPEEKEK